MSGRPEKPDLPDSISLLLVEDDDRAAERLSQMLARPEGTTFHVTRVLTVDDALLQLQEASYDVLLLDLSIDEGRGQHSLLRAQIAASHVPIVVLTFHQEETQALKAARAGAQDYLTKGEVTPALLTRTLLHAVERHRMVRELLASRQRQHFLATHDSLTQLPNRSSFLVQLRALLAAADRDDSQIAVMFCDLDGFKTVNDNLGHAVGDELLRDAAVRLMRAVRKSDLVARFGGDEFVVALRNVPDLETPTTLAEKIREEIERPYHIAGSECFVSVSVGISLFPHHGRGEDELVRCADAAMYQAKSSGKNRVSIFNSALRDQAAERFKLVNGLRDAIHGGQLVLTFQPQIHIGSEEIVAAETLVRWRHPVRGIVSPADFIPVAEGTGMMVPLGEWVLRTACAAAADWQKLSNVRVAVNVSGRQLDQADFPNRVGVILEEVGLAASRLEIEVTESLVLTEPALEALARLREMGVRTAIDDFGTGYSSLTMLSRLPVDLLKIDQSFVRGAAETAQDAVVLEAIIRMAEGLGLDAVAEGVETMEEMDLLRRRGCNLMQGFLFAKPIERQDFEAAVTAPDAGWRQPLIAPEAWSSGPVRSDDEELPVPRGSDPEEG